jgi:uncharacterized delta-60 repeat protein
VSAVLAAPDDRAVVVGTHDPGDGLLEWYWRAVGDTAVGAGCYVSPPGDGALGRANAAAFDSGGRLLLAGWGSQDGSAQMAVARFSYPDCELDDSFDEDGYWMLDVYENNDAATAISVDGDTGRIAIGGYFLNNSGVHTSSLVVLLDDTGEPVDGFSDDGLLWFHAQPTSENDSPVAGVAFDDAGNLVVAASFHSFPSLDWLAIRLTPAGTFDPTFGDQGYRPIAFDLGGPNADDDRLFALARDPNGGKLVLVGEAQTGSGYAMAIARLLPDGAFDPSFAGDGQADLAFANAHARLEAVHVDGLGRIVVAGFLDYSTGDSDVVALRFDVNGALDPTFGYGGLSLIAFDFGPETNQDDYGRALAIQAGRAVVAGNVEVNTDQDFRPGLARLQNALIFADGFESAATAPWSGAN